MATSRERITTAALKILGSYPNGVHYADLVRGISEEHPDIPVNTIHGTVWNLETGLPNEV